MGYKPQQYECEIQVMHVREGVDPGVVTRSDETWAKAPSFSQQVLDDASYSPVTMPETLKIHPWKYRGQQGRRRGRGPKYNKHMCAARRAMG